MEFELDEKKRLPYAKWEVDGVEYKLKLDTSTITKLEEQFKTNLLNIIMTDNSIPALKIMLTITHGAMLKYHHGIKYKDVEALYDKYTEEGGSQTSFMMNVFIPIYQASGFFSSSADETMSEKLAEAKEKL